MSLVVDCISALAAIASAIIAWKAYATAKNVERITTNMQQNINSGILGSLNHLGGGGGGGGGVFGGGGGGGGGGIGQPGGDGGSGSVSFTADKDLK